MISRTEFAREGGTGTGVSVGLDISSAIMNFMQINIARVKMNGLYRRSENYKTTFCTSSHDDGNELVDTGDGQSERLKFLECNLREMFAIQKSAKSECA